MKMGPWSLVVLLFATAVASYLCRVNTSVAGALMMRDLGFTQIEMGRIFSAFVLGYAIFQVPGGLGADRWGTGRLLGWSALWWVAATALISTLGWWTLGTGAFSILSTLLILRFILGVGEAPTFPAAARGVALWIPRQHQGLASGIVLAAVGAGAAIAPALVSSVMVRWGWRVALLASAVPALAAALTWFSTHTPETGQIVAAKSALPKQPIRWSRSFILLTLSYTIEGYVGYIFIFWFYLYLVEVRHFDLLRAGTLSSLPGVLSMISIPLGGLISDRLVRGRVGAVWGRRAVPMAGLAFSGVLLILGAGTSKANLAVVCLALAMASVLAVEGPFWATMIRLSGPSSGTAGGVMNCGSNIGGLVSPALTPVLAAYLGWENALYIAAGLSIVGALLWLGISAPAEEQTHDYFSQPDAASAASAEALP